MEIGLSPLEIIVPDEHREALMGVINTYALENNARVDYIHEDSNRPYDKPLVTIGTVEDKGIEEPIAYIGHQAMVEFGKTRGHAHVLISRVVSQLSYIRIPALVEEHPGGISTEYPAVVEKYDPKNPRKKIYCLRADRLAVAIAYLEDPNTPRRRGVGLGDNSVAFLKDLAQNIEAQQAPHTSD